MNIQGWSVAGKAYTGLIGSLLTFIVPWIVQVTAGAPDPWPSLVAAAVALATAFGVYRAPYAPVTHQNSSGSGGTPWPAE